MGDIIRIQHRGLVGDLKVGSTVVVESCDENFLCLRVATFADKADDLRVASPKQHAADMAEMKAAGVADERGEDDK